MIVATLVSKLNMACSFPLYTIDSNFNSNLGLVYFWRLQRLPDSIALTIVAIPHTAVLKRSQYGEVQ